jgi:hypothetical protein
VVVGERPRAADPNEDLRPVSLGQQVTDIALLVAMTPMHEGVLAEHVLDRLAQRPDAVNAVANFEFERLIDRVRGPRRRNRS